MSVRVILVGDSWGVGEWNNGVVVNAGLQDILTDQKYTVLNYCIPAASNGQSIDVLYKKVAYELLTNSISYEKTKIYCFWTEWHRDFQLLDKKIHNLAVPDVESFLIPRNFDQEFLGKYQHRMLNYFSEFAKKHQCEIGIIGGASDLYNFDLDHQNIYMVCQSLTNLVLEKTDKVIQPVLAQHYPQKFVKTLYKKINSIELTQLVKLLELSDSRRLKIANNKCYFPDGSHLNRDGYKIFYDLMLKHDLAQ